MRNSTALLWIAMIAAIPCAEARLWICADSMSMQLETQLGDMIGDLIEKLLKGEFSEITMLEVSSSNVEASNMVVIIQGNPTIVQVLGRAKVPYTTMTLDMPTMIDEMLPNLIEFLFALLGVNKTITMERADIAVFSMNANSISYESLKVYYVDDPSYNCRKYRGG